jgi:hypothetical protein
MNAYNRENVTFLLQRISKPHTLYTEEEILKRILRKFMKSEEGK